MWEVSDSSYLDNSPSEESSQKNCELWSLYLDRESLSATGPPGPQPRASLFTSALEHLGPRGWIPVEGSLQRVTVLLVGTGRKGLGGAAFPAFLPLSPLTLALTRR